MSILYLRSRPIMAFDENNLLHRQYYFDFVQTNTWANCPVRFMAESLNTDLVSHINQKMLKYYVQKEFKNMRNRSVKKSTAKDALRSVQPKLSV
jgi:hypothetical protein